MISLDYAIPYVPPAPDRTPRSKKTFSSFKVQAASSDAIDLQYDFNLGLAAMPMPIQSIDSIDRSSIPDSESERHSQPAHKTFSTNSDSLPKMRDSGYADDKITPHDADKNVEFPGLDELLSASHWRKRGVQWKGSSCNPHISLERTPEQLDRQPQSDNSAVSSQPVAGDSQGRAILIDDDDISMAFGTTEAESGGVGTVDLDSITTASLHGLGGETEKTEYGLNFDQRIPISLAQSESATSSDLAIPNDGSRSISDLAYSNGDATNLLKKRKKRKNHRYRSISNNPSLFMKGTATSTNAKVDGVDPDMPSCDDIDEIENDKRPPSERRQRSSFTAHSDASRNHTASNVISERLHDSIIGRAGSQGCPIEVEDGLDNPIKADSHFANLDVTESETKEVAASNKAPSVSLEYETLSCYLNRATVLPNLSVRSQISLADDPDKHDYILFNVDETLSNSHTGCQGRDDLVRKSDCPEQIFDDSSDNESRHHSETVWKYTRFVGHKIGDDGRKYVKVQWEPTWEPLNELSGGEKALKAYQERQSSHMRVETQCRQHRSGQRKPGQRRKGQRS